MDRSNVQPIYGYYGYLHILVNASIKWWLIDRSIKCAAQSIKRADPSNARDIYINITDYNIIHIIASHSTDSYIFYQYY